MTDRPAIQYLNTDLDLVCAVSLDNLAAILESRGVSPLDIVCGDDGQWYATFETDTTHCEPEASIGEMLSAIESLAPLVMQTWKECTKREFNIGYDCGDEPWAFNQGLSTETLRRMAQCGCTLRITLYPHVKRAAQG